MMTDPIADMLTRIRNAGRRATRETVVPVVEAEARDRDACSQRAGFLDAVRGRGARGHAELVLGIRYDDGGRPLIDGHPARQQPGAASTSARTSCRACATGSASP